MSQPEEGHCHGPGGVDVELASVSREPRRLSDLRHLAWWKPGQGNLANHHSARVPFALLHFSANSLLSASGAGYSGEGSGEQDCCGYGAYVRPSQRSKHAIIISSQRASSAQTITNYLMRNRLPAVGENRLHLVSFVLIERKGL